MTGSLALPLAAFLLGLASGGLVPAFGLAGFARAADLGDAVLHGLLCL